MYAVRGTDNWAWNPLDYEILQHIGAAACERRLGRRVARPSLDVHAVLSIRVARRPLLPAVELRNLAAEDDRIVTRGIGHRGMLRRNGASLQQKAAIPPHANGGAANRCVALGVAHRSAHRDGAVVRR